MNSIGAMYDDIFKTDDNYMNSIFEGLRLENNPTLEPIEEMFNEIFDPLAVKDNREFEKIDNKKAKELQYGLNQPNLREEDEESELVIGEPVYHTQYSTIWNKDL